MNAAELYPDASRSLDSLRQMRLLALLRDVVDDEGKVKAAKTLGVNYRTVSRAVETGTLTERMSDALERHLLLGGGSAAAQQRERVETLEKRSAELDEELRGRLEAVAGEVKGLLEEQAKALRRLERRLVRLEAGRGAQDGAETPSATGPETEPTKRRYVPPRTYPQLVTQEAEPDEELVYGDAAPVIVEWRRARAGFGEALNAGTALERAEANARVLELEIAIIEQHELTLPPADYPWDSSDRRDHLWRRRKLLRETQAERRGALLRRWLRRVLTCGLWRN